MQCNVRQWKGNLLEVKATKTAEWWSNVPINHHRCLSTEVQVLVYWRMLRDGEE